MLDFQKRKKKYFDVTLHDGTQLEIPAPTMVTFDAMREVSENPRKTELLKPLVLLILSTNKQRTEITEEQICAFNVIDMRQLFVDYAAFVKDTLSDPN